MSSVGIIWTKLDDVLESNVLDILNKASDPVKMFNLMLERMHAFRDDQVVNINRAMEAEEGLETQVNAAKQSVEKWTRRAGAAVDKKDDDEARKALGMQVTEKGRLTSLTQSHDTQKQSVHNLQFKLEQLDQKIDALEGQRSVVEARVASAKARASISGPVERRGFFSRRPLNPDQVAAGVEHQIQGLEAKASAAERTSELAEPQTIEVKFAKSEHDAEVDRLLAEMKEVRKQ